MEGIVKLYNSQGGKYLSKMYLDNGWTIYLDKKEKAIVLQLLNKHARGQLKNKKILDLGMGPGRWSKFFIDIKLSKVVGLDISPVMVDYAKQWIKNSHFQAMVGDIEKIPIKERFDIVFCFRAFKYVDHPERAFEEIKRVLKPEGLALIEFANNSLTSQMLKYCSSVLSEIKRKKYSEDNYLWYFNKTHFYDFDGMDKIITSNGFDVVEKQIVSILPAIPLPGRGKVWIYIDKVLTLLLPPSLFARSVVILAKKKI